MFILSNFLLFYDHFANYLNRYSTMYLWNKEITVSHVKANDFIEKLRATMNPCNKNEANYVVTYA